MAAVVAALSLRIRQSRLPQRATVRIAKRRHGGPGKVVPLSDRGGEGLRRGRRHIRRHVRSAVKAHGSGGEGALNGNAIDRRGRRRRRGREVALTGGDDGTRWGWRFAPVVLVVERAVTVMGVVVAVARIVSTARRIQKHEFASFRLKVARDRLF